MWFRSLLYRLAAGRAEGPEAALAADFTTANATSALAQILTHAVARVPFYRDQAGLDPADIRTWPVLSRGELRRDAPRFHSDDARARRTVRYFTGGSTGEPLTILHDRAHRAWVRAGEQHLYDKFLGVDFAADPKLVIWGSPVDVDRSRRTWRKRAMLALSNTHLVDAFRMTPDDMRRFVALHNRLRPALVKSYAGALARFARFIRQEGLRVHSPRSIYVSAEVLRPEARGLIEETFNCRVTDVYSAREIGVGAAQCPRGNYHGFHFAVHLEILDDSGIPVAEGAEGRVVATTLRNYSMPLVRYDMGDRAVAGGKCPCGLAGPVIRAFSGRKFEHFRLADGTFVHGGYFTNLMFSRTWVREYQFVQRDVDDVRVLVVPACSPHEDEVAAIIDGTRRVMGAGCRVEYLEVEELPPTRHGKLLQVISNLEDA